MLGKCVGAQRQAALRVGAQAEYADKGLRVVGVSVEEQDGQLRQFVNQQGDKMAYTVAVSDRRVALPYQKSN